MPTVAEVIANHCNAYNNTTSTQWRATHYEYITQIERDFLPSGSGIDNGTRVVAIDTDLTQIVLNFSFHHMNNDGYYDGWTDYTVTVTPTFIGLDVEIKGENRNQIKDYLVDVFHHALNQEIYFNKEKGKYALLNR